MSIWNVITCPSQSNYKIPPLWVAPSMYLIISFLSCLYTCTGVGILVVNAWSLGTIMHRNLKVLKSNYHLFYYFLNHFFWCLLNNIYKVLFFNLYNVILNLLQTSWVASLITSYLSKCVHLESWIGMRINERYFFWLRACDLLPLVLI